MSTKIQSMTGFGRDIQATEDYSLECSLKSVNHRYLKVKTYLPDELKHYEFKIKEIISNRIERGMIRASFNLNFYSKQDFFEVHFDKKLFEEYIDKVENLSSDQVPLNALVSQMPDLNYLIPQEEKIEQIWVEMKKSLTNSLNTLIGMRIKEGNSLKEDLLERKENIQELVNQLQNTKEQALKNYSSKLEERIRKLTRDKITIDKDRIAQEAAVYAEKSDYAEELTRLQSHLSQFEGTLKQGGRIGKRLKFLSQEMHREAHTIGSKAVTDKAVSKSVKIKEEVERIREQSENIQ